LASLPDATAASSETKLGVDDDVADARTGISSCVGGVTACWTVCDASDDVECEAGVDVVVVELSGGDET
jgi:hypothetical protein